MSYEGYREYLCVKGHYDTRDAYDGDLDKCERCGERIRHRHGVDQTNGVIDDQPSTQPAPKEQVGYEDEWRTDHHGNRYAVMIPLYQAGAEWAEIGANAAAE